MARIVKIKTAKIGSDYDVRIEGGLLRDPRKVSKKFFGRDGRKVAVVSNKKVFGLYGEVLVRTVGANGYEPYVCLIGDGERYKNVKTLQTILGFLSRSGLSRTDLVVALGGGVVGDVGGFAAAVYLRGIPFIQVPTTLLSMIDSSVGGKTGINTEYGKNLIGAFYQPRAVLIDPTVLSTLQRELTSGLCEAVKQGAIAGTDLFDQTAAMIDELDRMPFSVQIQDRKFAACLERLLADHIGFKLSIVKGDERESSSKNDAKSRKILNFGHTLAHALERASGYRYLKHGEAVGYGIIFAATLSKKLGFLDENVVNLLRGVVHRTGPLPSIRNIDPNVVFDTFRFDKKNISGSLQWVLLKGIGKPVITPHNEIGDRLVRQTIKEIISA